MIKIRSQQELVEQINVASTLVANTTVKACIHSPLTGFIKAIYARLGTADGTSFQADIQKEGVSLASSGNLLIFGTTRDGVVTNLSASPTTVNKGDMLTVTTPTNTGGTAANLSIWIVFSKRPVAATESGTLSADFDQVD